VQSPTGTTPTVSPPPPFELSSSNSKEGPPPHATRSLPRKATIVHLQRLEATCLAELFPLGHVSGCSFRSSPLHLRGDGTDTHLRRPLVTRGLTAKVLFFSLLFPDSQTLLLLLCRYLFHGLAGEALARHEGRYRIRFFLFCPSHLNCSLVRWPAPLLIAHSRFDHLLWSFPHGTSFARLGRPRVGASPTPTDGEGSREQWASPPSFRVNERPADAAVPHGSTSLIPSRTRSCELGSNHRSRDRLCSVPHLCPPLLPSSRKKLRRARRAMT